MQPINISKQVGSKKLFENEKVVLWDFELDVGAETQLHTHERSYVWYTIQGSSLQVLDKDGRDCGTLEVPTGSVFELNVENDVIEVISQVGQGAKVPATHTAKNVGSSIYREILVEFK
ncbi:hypothetical protein F889_02790 [Acinetobacter colistiniresistens]|uniref:Cupin domain-containing protein n=1 Tax=Acinetobacter colistiniresistens TaxID=280145 RepID=N9QVR8_9GAMM|nr:hypothetical protein [Acinetobacter colistiniresistens]ENX34126.1 hypothetical protein F889_02790 [Acinetobacter colistiniresistens]